VEVAVREPTRTGCVTPLPSPFFMFILQKIWLVVIAHRCSGLFPPMKLRWGLTNNRFMLNLSHLVLALQVSQSEGTWMQISPLSCLISSWILSKSCLVGASSLLPWREAKIFSAQHCIFTVKHKTWSILLWSAFPFDVSMTEALSGVVQVPWKPVQSGAETALMNLFWLSVSQDAS